MIKLDLIPVSYWFEYLDLVFFYKCRNGLFNFDIFKYVTPYSNNRVTRNSFISIDYKPNLTKTSTFRDSYFNRIIPLWNSLPLNTKESTTLSSFKTKVRSHYKSLLHLAFDPDRIRTFKTICSKCRSVTPATVCCRLIIISIIVFICIMCHILYHICVIYCITYVYISMGHDYMDFESFHALLKLLNEKINKIMRSLYPTLNPRSKSSLVEHSTIIRNGKIQHQLLNQEYSFTITKRLPSTTHRKDREVLTENTLENPLISESRHDLVFKGNLRLQINQKSTSHRRIKRFRERYAKDDPVRKIQASKQPLPQ